MIARTLAFGSPGKLTVRDEQLVWDGENEVHRTFPVEDLGFVIVENERIVVSSFALHKLAEANVALVICDGKHMPVAQMQPFAAHTTTSETVAAQFSASEAVQGRLWRLIVRQKILNQAELMKRLRVSGDGRLRSLAAEVKNYDPQNCEAQAARIYFQSLMPSGVNRDAEGDWPNAPLNYGYAILRAAVARALVGSGLLCVRGIHHHSRYDAFCLADDMMEPYRPFVDQYVLGKVRPFDVPMKDLTKEMKARLLEMLTCDVQLGEVRRPLMVALTYTSASLARYYLGKGDSLSLPSFV